jgi:hypothetical protein
MGISSELRIGNLVYFDGEIVKVSCTQILECSKGNIHLVPIDLTDEIILKLGFEHINVIGFYAIDIGNDTFLVSGGDSVWVEKLVNSEYYSVALGGAENVHQLQNLFFSLCNKELPITNL